MKIPSSKKPLRLIKILVSAAFFSIFALICLLSGSFEGSVVEASAFGPAPGYTGAVDEGNCTACHSSYAVNSGSGNIQISGIPRNYKPGQQIPVTVTVNQSDAVLFGFELTAIDSTGNKAGDLTFPSASPQPLQTVNGFINGILRQYIEHTNQGITPTVFGTKSWQFTWTAPSARVGKISFYAAGNGADSNGSTSGDYIYTTSTSTYTDTNIASFDDDAITDISVYRPSEGNWYSLNTKNNSAQIFNWGISTDVLTPGDYDGDGIADRAVFRPSNGLWYILRSSGGVIIEPWGLSTDKPVAKDYDGDLKTDIAMYRPSNGTWYIIGSGGNQMTFNWGIQEDIPTPADFDGDGKADPAVFRPSNGTWYVLKSTGGSNNVQWGTSSDIPIQADYDGDGKADIAVYRPSTGEWWIISSRNGSLIYKVWGISSDIPTPGDFDGDGKTDIAVYRPSNGFWYIIKSSDQTQLLVEWGISTDVPVPPKYLGH